MPIHALTDRSNGCQAIRTNIARPRRGAAAIIAMGCLVVAAIVMLVLIKGLAAQRLRIEGERDANQAALLADSGIEMAKTKLDADPDYRGETWTVLAEQLQSDYSGEVVINIDDSGMIQVVAIYPYHEQNTPPAVTGVRCERSVKIDMPATESTEDADAHQAEAAAEPTESEETSGADESPEATDSVDAP